MKTTAFKIFASCVAIVCLASSPVTRAASILKSGPSSSENPIVEKQSIKDKNLVRLNFDDLESHDSRLIANEVEQKPAMAVHEPTVPHESHRQLRSYNPKVEEQLRRELEGDTSSISVDSKEAVPVLPDPSNEVQDSQQSNEIQNSQSNEVQDSQQSNEVQDSQQSNEVQDSQQSNEVQDSQQSNEVQDSQQSNEVQDSQQSNEVQNSQSNEFQNSQSSEAQDSKQFNEDSQMSDDKYNYTELPTPYGSNESYDPEDISADSEPTNDDKEESDTIKPTTLL